VSARRFLVLLLAGFAGFALSLASLGIFEVISYSVNQRVQEIGIRMALGASATDLQSRILLRTLGLAALGLALGMATSRALTGALESLLFGVSPGDPVTFIGIGALLIVVAASLGIFPLAELRESIPWRRCERIERKRAPRRVVRTGSDPGTGVLAIAVFGRLGTRLNSSRLSI
jgi:predicted lysophospholipase L1 biosynthesis ABC-type transport system permease subunit